MLLHLPHPHVIYTCGIWVTIIYHHLTVLREPSTRDWILSETHLSVSSRGREEADNPQSDRKTVVSRVEDPPESPGSLVYSAGDDSSSRVPITPWPPFLYCIIALYTNGIRPSMFSCIVFLILFLSNKAYVGFIYTLKTKWGWGWGCRGPDRGSWSLAVTPW